MDIHARVFCGWRHRRLAQKNDALKGGENILRKWIYALLITAIVAIAAPIRADAAGPGTYYIDLGQLKSIQSFSVDGGSSGSYTVSVTYYDLEGKMINPPGTLSQNNSNTVNHTAVNARFVILGVSGNRNVSAINFYGNQNGAGVQQRVPESAFETDPPEYPGNVPPNQVVGLSADAGNARVQLSWTAIPNVMYNIYRNGQLITTQMITSYTDANVTNDTSYTYQVSAVNAKGEGIKSTPITVTPKLPIIPVPADLKATAGNARVQLSWTAVSNATYNIYRNGQLIATQSGTTYTDTGVTNGTTYTYTVSAIVDNVQSLQTAPVTAKPEDLTPPSTPTGLTGKIGNKSASIAWQAVTGVAGYNVYRDGVKQNSALLITPSLTQSGLTNGTAYSYQVSAVSSSGIESPRSAALSLKPNNELNVNLVPNGTSIIVQASGGRPPYTVDWGDGDATFNATQYTITGLQLDTTYTVTVTDADGQTYTRTLSTGTTVGFVPPTFPSPQEIFQIMIDTFGVAGTIALAVIGGAIALGILTVLALFGWRLLKRWMSAAR